MSKAKKKAIEEELEELQKEGGDEDDDVENEQLEDQLEAAILARGSNTWASGGIPKDIAIRVLIQCFGSMVQSIPRDDSLPDHRGRFRLEDMVHHKLLDAAKQVVRAKGILLKNENFDSRDFTLFIARKKWAYNILRPLLELCAKEDSTLAMKICSLALVLIKKISDKTMKQIQNAKKAVKKTPANATTHKPSLEDDAESRSETEITGVIANAKEQTAALLSFKEALCSEKCNEAITNAFREFWMKEQQISTPDTKIGVAICLSYFRRILAITAHTDWSTPHELLQQQVIHHQYIVQLRVLLSLIPAILSDLRRNYHDDWLGDVLLILYYIVQSFDPYDMYLVWKSKGVMPHFRNLLNMSEEVEEPTTSKVTGNSSGVAQGKGLNTTNNVHVPVPSSLSKQYQVSTLSKGNLSNKLSQERQQRMQSTGMLQMQPRFGNRFSGTYRIPVAGNSAATATSNTNGISTAGANAVSTQNAASTTAATNAPIDIDNNDDDPNAGGVKSIAPNAMLIRNPFSLHTASLPSGKTKRNKRNLSFAKENPFLRSSTPSQMKSSPNSQQACVIVTSLIDIVLDEACFKAFIRRINEDLRRDEMRITSDMELQYFHIVMKCLEFYRFTLHDSYHQFLLDGKTGTQVPAGQEDEDEEDTNGWKPHLINVIDTLDKMSFTRVIFAIDRLNKNTPTMDKVEYPLMLYKEMLAYLHILLYSSLEGHHDIALGALYRLFYTSSERLDPLPKLLSHWKPATYTKTMTTTLLEVWLLTLQVQELVKQVFANKGIYTEQMYLIYKQKNAKKTKSAKGKKAELDMEQYLLSLLRFRNEEYLLKVCHSNSVNMLMRVVEDMIDTSNANMMQSATNREKLNEVIYELLQRVCMYPLYTDSSNPPPIMDEDLRYQSTIYGQPTATNVSKPTVTPAVVEATIKTMSSFALKISSGYQIVLPKQLPKVHLGYLFFTLRSFVIMHTFITSIMNVNTNSVIVPLNPAMSNTLYPTTSLAPIARMFTLIIRSFQELTASNHMMYIELLCPTTTSMTTRMMEHYQHFATVYDAKEHLLYYHLHRDENGQKKGNDTYGDELPDNMSAIGDSSSSEDSDLGDEFDENQVFTKSKLSEKDEAKIKKNQKRLEREKFKAVGGNGKLKKTKSNKKRSDSSSEDSDLNDKKDGSSSDEEKEGKKSKKKTNRLTEEDEVAEEEEFQQLQRASRKKWTEQEDTVLKRLYTQYAGSRSVFTSILHHADFKALDTKRNERQLANRVKELQLHLSAANANDDEDAGNEEEEEEEATQRQVADINEEHVEKSSPEKSKTTTTITSKPYWELNDDEQDDIFEKRSLGLLMHTRNLYEESSGTNDVAVATTATTAMDALEESAPNDQEAQLSSKKRSLETTGNKGKSKILKKKQKKGGKKSTVADSDDEDFADTDDVRGSRVNTQAMDEQETAPQFADELENTVAQNPSIPANKARGKVLDSDEEN